MIYEYRMYEAVPGKMPDLHKRFREITTKLFDKHGYRVVAFFEPSVGSVKELHYILEWDDMGEMQRAWDKFRADPEWLEARKRTEANGPLVVNVRNEVWRLTDYSPRIKL